jgi:cytochrome c biogenesis protein CcdA
MIFFLVSILAGVLTVLAPCILPLLPIVVGSSAQEDTSKKSLPKRSLVVIGSLAVSVILFTLLLKASTLLITIPQSFWQWFSGVLIVLVGFALVFPEVWARVPGVSKISQAGNKALGVGYKKQNHTGDIIIGFALGPVFTTCSPTYLFIIATILPASLLTGLWYLLGFVIGLVLVLILIAYFGNKIIAKLSKQSQTADRVKKVFGVILIIIGVAIITGYDKKFETTILESGYGATIHFEEALIERFSK